MKSIFQVFILLSIIIGIGGCSSAPVGNALYEKANSSSSLKIATLDVTRAIRSSKVGQKQRAELDMEFKEAKASLDQQEKAIKTPEDRYHFKMSIASAQKKINASENQKVAPLLEYVRSTAKKIAERDGFDKVVESEPTNGYTDITGETIQALDQL